LQVYRNGLETRQTHDRCTVGAFVLITGRMGDMWGKKRLFVAGWVWLAIFNIAIGFSPNEIVYDGLRALAGIGLSALMPNASALFGTAYPPGQRKNVVFAIFGAVAPSTSPTLAFSLTVSGILDRGYLGRGFWTVRCAVGLDLLVDGDCCCLVCRLCGVRNPNLVEQSCRRFV
jgi:MFS family permease